MSTNSAPAPSASSASTSAHAASRRPVRARIALATTAALLGGLALPALQGGAAVSSAVKSPPAATESSPSAFKQPGARASASQTQTKSNSARRRVGANQQISNPFDTPSSTPATTTPAATTTTATAPTRNGIALGASLEDRAIGTEWSLFADREVSVSLTDVEENPMLMTIVREPATMKVFPLMDTPANVDISMTAYIEKSTNDWAIGAFCRARDKDRYVFLIGNTGVYQIIRADEEGWTSLLPGGRWATSAAIPKDFNMATFTARCAGDRLSILVGGQAIASVRDTTLNQTGVAGALVSNWAEDDEVRVFIDNMSITAAAGA
jgi:hypothetical protein